jgi:hypothetical protein
MKNPIVHTFNFQGHDVRVAFDKDAYIFLEDAERLHHLFSEKSLFEFIDPNDIFTIIVNEERTAPQEQKVFPIYKMEEHIETPPDIAAESYDRFQIFIWGVDMAKSQFKHLIKHNINDLKDPAWRDEMLEKAHSWSFAAQVEVVSGNFFIDFWSKSPEEIITYEYLDPDAIPASRWSRVNEMIRKEAPNEAPIA